MKDENKMQPMINTILKAVALAMGVAVIVTSVIPGAKTDSGHMLVMLAIGVTALAINAFSKNDKQ